MVICVHQAQNNDTKVIFLPGCCHFEMTISQFRKQDVLIFARQKDLNFTEKGAGSCWSSECGFPVML